MYFWASSMLVFNVKQKNIFLYDRTPWDDSLASDINRINYTNMLTCQIKDNSFRQKLFVLKAKGRWKNE